MEEIVIKSSDNLETKITKQSRLYFIQQAGNRIMLYHPDVLELADAIYKLRSDNVIVVPDNYSVHELAADVANMLKDGYGEHNYRTFVDTLTALLGIDLERKAFEAGSTVVHDGYVYDDFDDYKNSKG